MPLVIPSGLTIPIAAHKEWLQVIRETRLLVEKDIDIQRKAAAGTVLRGRSLPPLVLGNTYAKYCDLINRMYDAYGASEQLQRATYMRDIISIMMRRMFELRRELADLILNDYIYVDKGLFQNMFTPTNIEVVFPCHLAMETREGSVEELLQTMWADSIYRQSQPAKTTTSEQFFGFDFEDDDIMSDTVEKSESIVITEAYIQAVVIQSHERFRQFFMADYKAKCATRRTYFAKNVEPPPLFLMESAARLVQKVYRKYMQIKRQRVLEIKTKIFLGELPDPWRKCPKLKEETKKLYIARRRITKKAREAYLQDLEAKNTRLIMLRKDNQIDDISEQIREWFKEW